MEIFVYAADGYFRWYVVEDTHVFAQGMAKSFKTAENQAKTVRAKLSWDLDGVLL